MGRLQGKTAVVLGAAGAGNMGQTIARRFAAEGAQVVVAGRRLDPLEALAQEIGGRAVVCDITVRKDVDTLARAALDWTGRLDVALNATGWGLLKPFLETTDEDLAAMTALQFIGPFQWMQATLAAMIEAGNGGSIIQVSSATATIMLNDHAAYMGTKAGTDHLVRCVANEFGRYGIRANSISPGLTATPMTAEAQATPGLFEAFAPCYPLGRVGTSDDIAEAAVWLAQDNCFMTGQNLQVNGGLTLRRNPDRDEISASVIRAMQPNPVS
ncbi:SDR family NAD(P)-dependent oxidoreductase [Phenylobacterium montanum]|uniref:D-xylose 1-dehydrogenase n=1 Tax=Phenylobacterium montanum TaxID=2823693 RepID=A0A975G4K5_9CAUL|nr:SDR family oxidoreductase [Caulobacter sp. S6]QUD90531.1 SDR family oxidoreductase [Caulobacter sp. S6]